MKLVMPEVAVPVAVRARLKMGAVRLVGRYSRAVYLRGREAVAEAGRSRPWGAGQHW